MKTKITELFGIKYPLFQGGMAWVSDGTLAAAVSNGGGLGLIASGSAPADVVEKEIRRCRALTDKPFGVNIMLMSPHAPAIAELVIKEQVPVVTTGAGNPGKYMEAWKAAGVKVVPVIPSVALAQRVERLGADAVVAEGCESGGHIGEATTMSLVPQVADGVNIPVIAAGGIGDGRGIAAALMLGAQGVQLGTRFLASTECPVHPNYKQMVLDAKDTDTAVTGRAAGRPVRAIRNRLTRRLSELEQSGASPDEFEELALGSLRRAVQDGDREEGSFMAGQIAGLIREVKPCGEIIQELFGEAEDLLQHIEQRRGVTIG